MGQHYAVTDPNLYKCLNGKGLINRGYCPYTGAKIDTRSLSWSYMGSRKVYVSPEGLKIMKEEADERHLRFFGFPKK